MTPTHDSARAQPPLDHSTLVGRCNSPLADCPRVIGGRSVPNRPTRSYPELSLLSSLSLSISSPTRPLSSPRRHGGAPIAPSPFGASTLAGASLEVVVAELHRLAIIFFPEIEVSPKFHQVPLPLLQGQGQARAQVSPRPLYSNLWHLTGVLAIAGELSSFPNHPLFSRV